MDSFKKHHHKRHGHGGHHHHKKQFGDYQTILDPVQSQVQPQPNNIYLDEKPIPMEIEEQKNFTEPQHHHHHHHHHRKEFNKDFKHKDHSNHHHSHRGGFGGKDRSRDGFKKHHKHNFNHQHHRQEESIPLEQITNSAQYQNIASLQYQDDSQILSNIQIDDAAFAKYYDGLSTKTPTTASSTDIANSINLSIKLKKQTIQANPNEWQTFPLLVSLAANNLKSLHKTPVDLVCVIDHSGSMAGGKIELVKQSFQSLFRYLGDSDRLSIVIFDDKASRLVPLMSMTNQNKAIITNALNSVYGQGGTDINLGMMHAFQILKSRKYINTATSIFLLSDGLDNRAQHKVKASCQAFDLPSNVSIHTFGFGSDHDPRLMTDIADLRDGNFYFINKLETVDECFIDCLGGIQSSISQNVIISVQAEQSQQMKGVQLLDSYGNSSMWTYHKDQCSTKLINLMAGRQKDYILKLRLPAIRRKAYEPATQVKIASVEAVILGLDGQQIVKKADLYVTLLDENENIVLYDNKDDFEVMKNYYRVKGAFMMNKARQLADEKQWIAARKSLQSFRDEVQESALKDDTFIKNLLQDLEQAIINVDPEIYWKVGKHNLIANQRAQMYQKSNLDSKNNYQNALQIQMLQMLKKK